jgi:aspartate aminotransferase-like enzyme
MMGADMHHRTKDFERLYSETLADLKSLLATRNDVLMFAASGTGAMDASVSNLFCPGDRVIVCSAGKFGERWGQITRAYGLDVIELKAEYGEAVTADCVVAKLNSEPAIKGVFVQASETSTGVAHDVKSMADAVAKTDAIFVVDAITGLGTMPLDIDGWGLDVVIGGSQKSFMIPPGLAFCTVSSKAWAMAERSTLPHYYFDLKKEKASADKAQSSWTPAISLILAMHAALQYMKEVGMENLIRNAQLLAHATRTAAIELGMEPFARNSPSSSVTAVRAPEGMDSGAIVKGFRDDFGAIIANGQGTMKGKIFRMAHLGYFDIADMFAIVAALEMILHENGVSVEFGKGVAAVQRVYAEARKASLAPASV